MLSYDANYLQKISHCKNKYFYLGHTHFIFVEYKNQFKSKLNKNCGKNRIILKCRFCVQKGKWNEKKKKKKKIETYWQSPDVCQMIDIDINIFSFNFHERKDKKWDISTKIRFEVVRRRQNVNLNILFFLILCSGNERAYHFQLVARFDKKDQHVSEWKSNHNKSGTIYFDINCVFVCHNFFFLLLLYCFYFQIRLVHEN